MHTFTWLYACSFRREDRRSIWSVSMPPRHGCWGSSGARSPRARAAAPTSCGSRCRCWFSCVTAWSTRWTVPRWRRSSCSASSRSTARCALTPPSRPDSWVSAMESYGNDLVLWSFAFIKVELTVRTHDGGVIFVGPDLGSWNDVIKFTSVRDPELGVPVLHLYDAKRRACNWHLLTAENVLLPEDHINLMRSPSSETEIPIFGVYTRVSLGGGTS